MGKSGKKKAKRTGTVIACSGCKNFKPGRDGSGRCTRKDKKRSADDKPCSDFKPAT